MERLKPPVPLRRTMNKVKRFMRSPVTFAEQVVGIPLRPYQQPVAQAIVNSITDHLGLSIVVIFPRQSGKNMLQAIIEAYVLSMLHEEPAEIVKISPTARPQSHTGMRRLEHVLSRSLVGKNRWHKESGYAYRVGHARIYFLSGALDSNIVGATASTMLEIDEAQDISIEKYDHEIAPMVASTDATRVFWGTAWTSTTLLARELRLAREAELADGMLRSFVLSVTDIAPILPAYARFVENQVARIGRDNPLVKTQYYSEEIDAGGSMFNPTRQALMRGTHPPHTSPQPSTPPTSQPSNLPTFQRSNVPTFQRSHVPTCQRSNVPTFQRSHVPTYAFTIDVAGEDEAARDEPGAALQNPGRDATALTIFAIDTTTLADPLIAKPTYRVVDRHQWTGIKHSSLFARLIALIDLWQPVRIVIDSTGVGQTLASFLLDRYPHIVTPFVFTSSSKSALGWNFISLIETGRYKEYLDSPCEQSSLPAAERREATSPLPCHRQEGALPGQAISLPIVVAASAASPSPLAPLPSPLHSSSPLQAQFWAQIEHCQYTILDGPGQLMRWGVPDGTRDPATGDLVHDDLVISAALVTVLDDQPFGRAESKVLPVPDLFSGKDF